MTEVSRSVSLQKARAAHLRQQRAAAVARVSERANALAELLAHTLESYRDTLRMHTEAEHADAERCAGFTLPRNDAGDCGSCTTDLHILEAKARDLGVRLREEASR